jgi:hypothetical protein
MQNWKIRGTKEGKFAEVIVQALDWAAAADAGRAAPHMMDVRDVVLVDLPEVLMARLHSEHGFVPDRLLPAFARKDFMTAVGWKPAVVRTVVPDNDMGQIWLMGDYRSEGVNALVGCMAVIPQDADIETLYAHVDKFSQDVTEAIANTYAGRLLAA